MSECQCSYCNSPEDYPDDKPSTPKVDSVLPLDEWVEQSGLSKLRDEFQCHVDNAEKDFVVRACMISLRQYFQDHRATSSVELVEALINVTSCLKVCVNHYVPESAMKAVGYDVAIKQAEQALAKFKGDGK